MNPTPEEVARREFAQQEIRFRRLFQTVTGQGLKLPRSDARPILSAALDFAEWLAICPTESAVRVRMQKDQAAIRLFLEILEVLHAKVESGSVQLSIEKDRDLTPFGVLAIAVYRQLEKDRQDFQDTL